MLVRSIPVGLRAAGLRAELRIGPVPQDRGPALCTLPTFPGIGFEYPRSSTQTRQSIVDCKPHGAVRFINCGGARIGGTLQEEVNSLSHS